MRGTWVLLVALVAAIAASVLACTPSAWTELESVEELAEVFDRDADKTRMVLLLSPT